MCIRFLSLFLVLLYFCGSVTTSTSSTTDQRLPVITMGFLSSFHEDGVGKLIAGAVPLAVERINNRSDVLPGYYLNFTAGDSGMPGTYEAIRKMTEMRDEGAVSFIGPDHGCTHEAMVAAAWNLPMITYKCSDRKVSNKTVYSTFARTLPPSSKISKSVIALLKYFSWTKITLIVAENPADKQVEEALILLAKENKINITGQYNLPGNYISKDNLTMYEIIESSHRNTRVYVLLADTLALADLVRMMEAKGLLAKGEYVVVYVEEEELYNKSKHLQYIRPVTLESTKDSDFVSDPFRSVLILTPSAVINEAYLQFSNAVVRHSSEPPFNIPFHPIINVEIPIYAALAYDAVMLYAHALTKVLEHHENVTDGESILNYIRSRPYNSILGYSVMVDENGDAEGNYTLLALTQEPGSPRSMRPVGHFTYSEDNPLPRLHLNRTIDWIRGEPPLAEPRCGFHGELCQYKPDWRLLVICIICACVVAVAARFTYRHYRYEHKLACLLWKVDMKDVILVNNNSEYTLQNLKNTINMQGFETSRFSLMSERCVSGSPEEPVPGRCMASIGFYRGNVVFFKPVFRRSVDLSRSIRKEMIQMREMRHENINPFIGACVELSNIGILTNFAARGSLEDVLMNEDMDLDTMFVASLVYDLIKGMIYLHDSEIVSHGNLKTSNCLVDSRWVLQIADFGLHEFRASQEPPSCVEHRKRRGLLWRAPELLRVPQAPSRGTQKGDVYSFAIILYEIIGRSGPWGPNPPTVKCILERVMFPKEGLGFFRPSLDGIDAPDYVINCMEQCWDEDPEARPDFRFVNVLLREMQAGLKSNIFDNMIAMMEKYAYNLEGLVQERTNQLMEEKKKTENLLLRMLPKPVAEQLKRGQPVEAESFDLVTIYFSDIVGFTALSAVSTPLQVVDLLNDLYTCFDSIIGNYDVYKVETIGDAYMVVSGIPIPNGNQHAGQIASMALHLLRAIQSFEIRHRPGQRLRLRIGIHSGPCVAGVVGLRMPRYCLFGDTVNTASRMESTGEALKIHVSEQCKDILDKLGGYVLQERGLTPVKGKGEMRTYWLLGREGPDVLGISQTTSTTRATVEPRPPGQQTSSINGDSSQSMPTDFLAANLHVDSDMGLDSLLLIGDRQPDERARLLADHNYNSCLSLFQECKRALLRELRRESRHGHRSAPTIAFRERSDPPHNFLF